MDDTLDELLITLFQNMCLAEEDGNGASGCSGYVGPKLQDCSAIWGLDRGYIGDILG